MLGGGNSRFDLGTMAVSGPGQVVRSPFFLHLHVKYSNEESFAKEQVLNVSRFKSLYAKSHIS